MYNYTHKIGGIRRHSQLAVCPNVGHVVFFLKSTPTLRLVGNSVGLSCDDPLAGAVGSLDFRKIFELLQKDRDVIVLVADRKSQPNTHGAEFKADVQLGSLGGSQLRSR